MACLTRIRCESLKKLGVWNVTVMENAGFFQNSAEMITGPFAEDPVALHEGAG